LGRSAFVLWMKFWTWCRTIFELRRQEEIGDWTELHKEQLHYLYSSPNIITMIKPRMSWARYVSCMSEIKNAYKILIRKLKGNRPLGRSRHRWEDNIQMNLIKISVRMWTGFIWLKTGTMVKCLWLPKQLSASQERQCSL
jgi:hypothetical protein